MPTVPIQLVGPSYQSRSIPLNAQVTRNLYPEPVRDGLSSAALLSWPGTKMFSEGASPNRGVLNKPWRGHVYVINGTKLIKIDSAGNRMTLGAIPGTGRCIIEAAAYWIYIVTEGLVYRSNGSTIEAVTDEDLESPNSVAFLKSFLIYDGEDGRFSSSAPGDGSDIDGLDYATAEALPDDLIRVYTFNQMAWMLGEYSGEPWWVSGNGNPPLDPVEGGLFAVGIGGVYAVTNTDKAMYFLGHDRTIYRLEGYSPIPVSSIGISNAIESYSDVSDCFAFSLRLQGQNYVLFTFPGANKTWVLSETINEWFEISTGLEGGRHLANGYCYAFGKHLVSDYRNGNIYEWDLNTFNDNGESILRERITQPIHSDSLGAPGKEVFWNSITLFINSGYGLASGQGSNPQIMMSFSDDHGHSWSDEIWSSAGKQGQYGWEVTWDNLGSSVSRLYRFRFTDPIEFHMFKLFADIELGL